MSAGLQDTGVLVMLVLLLLVLVPELMFPNWVNPREHRGNMFTGTRLSKSVSCVWSH